MESVYSGLLVQAGQAGWAAVGVAVLVALLVGWLLFNSNSRNVAKGVVTPPGSQGWPLIGETLAFLDARTANAAAEFFRARVAKYGEVSIGVIVVRFPTLEDLEAKLGYQTTKACAQTFTTHLFFGPTVSLRVPDGNKFLFANENKLVQNSWPPSVAKMLGPHSLSLKVGDEHRKARRMITTFFNPEGLQRFVPRMDAITRDHLATYWKGKESILGVPTVKEFTFAVAAGLFVSMSKQDPRYRPLEDATEAFLGGLLQFPIDLPGTAYNKGKRGRDTMYGIIDTVIAERKQELKEGKVFSEKDLLTVMLSTPNEDGVLMSDDAIKENINLMLFAGHDTSSITLAVVLKYLYLNPDCLKKVIEEQQAIALSKEDGAPLEWSDTRKMKYTWQVVQEALRLQPPVLGAFRTALQDFQFAGYTILKGWKLYWTIDRTHRDPAYFPDPDKFDPARFDGSGPPPFVWVPFGGGPHICLGNEFARTEMMVFLHYIVREFEWTMVDPDEPISIDPMPVFKKKMQLQIQKKLN